jgi:hypothetical protein
MVRPGLNGLRVHLRAISDTKLYLIDQGKARHIINPNAYNAIFVDYAGVYDLDVPPDFIEFGPDLDGLMTRWGAVYYLDEGGPARHVADPQTLMRYHLRTDVPEPSVDPARYPLGTPVEWTPGYDGDRIRLANQPEIYLIDGGKRRRIADPDTYRRLFGDRPVAVVASLDKFPMTVDLEANSSLVKGDRTPEVYLIDVGPWKRHIVDSNTMRYYGFDAGTVQVVAQQRIDALVSGPPIAWP